MRTGPLACALLAIALVACGGRADLLDSAGSTNDAGRGVIPDATAMQDAGGSAPDPTATIDAGAMCEAGSASDGAGAPACYLPSWTRGAGCSVAVPPRNNGCGPSEYQVACPAGFALPNDATCSARSSGGGGTDYCCPCLGSTDAGAFCADVDLSTYDQSCCSDADCTVIWGGMECSGDCDCGGCGGTAVNVDGQTRYEQTVAPLRPTLSWNCNCAACNETRPACVQGVCTLVSLEGQ